MNNPGAAAIRISGVDKSFTDAAGAPLEVLKAVDLAIAEGSIVALLGASGSGKSTLLNLIAGVVKPGRGTVEIGGVTNDRFTDWGALSYMFQEDRLLPWRTARRNIEFALEAGSMAKVERERRAQATLELVDLKRFEEAFPYQLSGGMRSRVALARSLVSEPRILLMDEPFSRLDAQTRAQMHGELLRVHELKQMTIVFVTHDVEEAALLADRVAVMSPRPGTIRAVVEIAMPRPRDATDSAIVEYIRRLRSLI